jgi:molybdate transport system ATP-binding protein
MTIDARLRLARTSFTLDVDLSLPGEGVSALFGPSGCGKTTLLRALAGLERGQGRVALGGTVWQDDAAGVFVPTHRRAIGYVIQEAALFPHLSVAGNLAYGRRRSPGSAGRVSLDAVVDLLGIGALMGRRPDTLSGGERQRVAIARALATGPELLLLDEPLAALDAPRKAEILPYLERLQRELALPVVYVSHAMDEVARLASYLVLMQEGRVLAAGPLAELLARPDLPLAHSDDAGVVIEAQIQAHDPDYALTQIGFAGGALWVGASPAAVGSAVRARVLARDVSVTRQMPQQTSIVNVLPARLDDLQLDHGTVLLQLSLGDPAAAAATATGARLLARITRKSFEALALRPGEPLYAQVKGVALM